MYANPLEWPEVHCWRRVLREGDLFVDIGANIGVYSIWAIELGASVVAVEADPEAAGMLRENLRLNGYEQCARVVEAAVADRPGTMRFTTDLGVENHLVLDDAATGPLREVPVTTLDSLLGDRSAAGAKIDVEGAEALVLQGARHTLAEGRIALIHLEWNSCSRAADAIALRSSVCCRNTAIASIAPTWRAYCTRWSIRAPARTSLRRAR